MKVIFIIKLSSYFAFQNINDFLWSKEPVICFSLGTVVKDVSMPSRQRRSRYHDTFVAAFAKLPYTVLCKFEEDIQDISKNVMIQKWMPQQDILGECTQRNILCNVITYTSVYLNLNIQWVVNIVWFFFQLIRMWSCSSPTAVS